MRQWFVGAARAALALVIMSCSGTDLTGPNARQSSEPSVRTDVVAEDVGVRISEFHYDNNSTDTGEQVEISGPGGLDLTGWKLVLYNGSATVRLPYRTINLTQTIVASCGTRGVVVIPTAGLENGAPDGMALVNSTGTVVEFLSYEGSFVAAGTAPTSPAAGMTSTDIGVSEVGTEPVDPTTGVTSLKRDGLGQWSGPSANNFGTCNDVQQPVQPVETVTVSPVADTVIEGGNVQFTAQAFDANGDPVPATTFTWSSSDETVATVNASGTATGVSSGSASITATTENGKFAVATLTVEEPPPDVSGPTFISELHYDNDGTDINERIEIEGPAGLNVSGWSIVLYNGGNGAPYGSTINLTGVIPSLCDGRGVLTFTLPSNGIQNGSPDGIALVKPGSIVAEFISYEGTFTAVGGPANGMLSTDIGVQQSGSGSDTRTLQRYDGEWYGPAAGSPGACNPPPPPPSISFSGRTPSETPLPVGFQDQLFATLTDKNSNEIETTYTWSSETPGIASIDQDGVITALAAGTATVRATTADGTTTALYSLPTVVATFSGVTYPGNAEFGEPADGNSADDFILRHNTFTSSYSSVRGTPNWVSYNLDPSHVGAQDRCDCFTFDPALPGSYTRYTTADYTGAGEFHGYGIDRGHLARSFDRTTGTLDNAFTFYFSNIIPQAADNNQGPWARLETYLLDTLAILQNKEVYIVAGVAGNKGTIKDEGVIVIPEYTWKVAVMLLRNQGLSSIDDYQDLQVIAVVMPNTAGIRNTPWRNYLTTVDAVETLSGYNILDLLPDPIEIAVESNTAPPAAAVDGPYTALEHESIAMSGSGSTDPDADALSYAWNFGDGATGTGVSTSHAYAVAGTYNVRLIVQDPLTLADTVVTTATIISPSQGAEQAIALVDQLLADGKLSAGHATSFRTRLQAVIRSLDRGQRSTAVNQLSSLVNELDDLVATGVLSAADAAPLRLLLTRLIASASQ